MTSCLKLGIHQATIIIPPGYNNNSVSGYNYSARLQTTFAKVTRQVSGYRQIYMPGYIKIQIPG